MGGHAATTRRMLEASFGYIDRVSERVIEVYQLERDRWLLNQTAVRAGRVREILAEKQVDTDWAESALGYRLRQHHIGMVFWLPERPHGDEGLSRLDRLTNEIAEELKCCTKPLFVARDEILSWSWLPFGSHPPRTRRRHQPHPGAGPRLGQARSCVLVLMGVRTDGSKELIALAEGLRESTESWADLLRDCRRRGMRDPELVVGDGAMGLWRALAEVFPQARHQRCWVHKARNVVNALPKSAQPGAKKALQEIYNAEDRDHAEKAVKDFGRAYGAKWPKAVKKITDDVDELLAFYDFPAEHWVHLGTTNPIESTFSTVKSTFSTVKLRTRVTRGAGSPAAALAMVFKLAESAQARWRAQPVVCPPGCHTHGGQLDGAFEGAALVPQELQGVPHVDRHRLECTVVCPVFQDVAVAACRVPRGVWEGRVFGQPLDLSLGQDAGEFSGFNGQVFERLWSLAGNVDPQRPADGPAPGVPLPARRQGASSAAPTASSPTSVGLLKRPVAWSSNFP